MMVISSLMFVPTFIIAQTNGCRSINGDGTCSHPLTLHQDPSGRVCAQKTKVQVGYEPFAECTATGDIVITPCGPRFVQDRVYDSDQMMKCERNLDCAPQPLEYETRGTSTRRAVCQCMQGYVPRVTGSVIRRPSDCELAKAAITITVPDGAADCSRGYPGLLPISMLLLLFHAILS